MKVIVVNLPIRYKNKKYNVGEVLNVDEHEFKNLSRNLIVQAEPKHVQKETELLKVVSEEIKKDPEKDNSSGKKEDPVEDKKKEVDKKTTKKASTKKKDGGKK